MDFIVKLFLILLLLNIHSIADELYVPEKIIQKIAKKYDYFAKRRFKYLNILLQENKNKSEAEKLHVINQFYNGVKYASDWEIYHKMDYWATPLQFLGKDKGDCEDYVIAKYFALRYLGISSKKMFFTYVRSSKFKAAHMVLTYYKTPRSEPLVLDNNNQKIFPASQRKDLTPVYNFNGEELYKISGRGAGKKVQNQKVHNKWDTLIQHMKRNLI
jgi:predicted transglutaminase-like cysteine proteinase